MPVNTYTYPKHLTPLREKMSSEFMRQLAQGSRVGICAAAEAQPGRGTTPLVIFYFLKETSLCNEHAITSCLNTTGIHSLGKCFSVV